MVRRRMPNISLGTVYRNLDRMRREGAALEIYCGDFVRYDGNTNPHDHFLCRGCRRVWDLDVPGEAPPTEVQDASAKGLAVEGRYTIYFGTCAECRGRPA
jgi:Fe2+ or Zn2+ uptake regulation protein